MSTKTSTNVTLDNGVIDTVDDLRKKPLENRSFSNMIEILVIEALQARGIKVKPKKK